MSDVYFAKVVLVAQYIYENVPSQNLYIFPRAILHTSVCDDEFLLDPATNYLSYDFFHSSLHDCNGSVVSPKNEIASRSVSRFCYNPYYNFAH